MKRFGHNGTVDSEEVERFSRLAGQWWDERGKFKILHRINPLRIGYIRDRALAHFGTLSGLSLLDIGCGGGLIAEPMCRLGASVTAIDASEQNIEAARRHAEAAGLSIDYRSTTAEALAAEGRPFDIVLALEIIEHVADVGAFVEACAALLAPGGMIVLSTLNRTAKSYALGIVAAEYLLGWAPRGTHDWKKFIRPSELYAALEKQGIAVADMTGMVFDPLALAWRLSPSDLAVNYMIVGKKS